MKRTQPSTLKENLVWYKEIFDNLSVGVMIIDPAGRVILVNKKQLKISQVTKKKVVGKFFHETWKSLVDGNVYEGKYWRMLNEGKPFTVIFHEISPQFYNEKLTGIAYGTPLPSRSGYILVHEVSEEMKQDKGTLKKLNRQLMAYSENLSNIIDSSPNAVITTNNEGLITSINKTAEDIFRFSRTDILWQPVRTLFERPGAIDIGTPTINNSGGHETTCLRADNSPFPARIQITNLKTVDAGNESKLYVISDISLVREMEMSLDNRLNFEKLISEFSAAFINIPIEKINAGIDEWLKHIVNFLDADRGLVVQILEDEITMQVTHSYAIEGVDVLAVGISSKDSPWFSKEIRQGRYVAVAHPDDMPPEAAVDKISLKKYQVRSIVSVPIMVGGKVIGAFSISTLKRARVWPDELIQRLQLVGGIFGNTFLRQKAEVALKRAFSEIKGLKEKIEAERNYLREEIKLDHNFEDIIGDSQTLKYALYKIERVAPTDATVLIEGETGTGKELIARAIHHASARNHTPLIKINCATLPDSLIESELFGHEKGAFTSATDRRIGRFELADGATLFLDEIGELPLMLQPKLLRVLQDGEFERLGSSKTIKTDVRVIAATNRDLEREVSEGRFRKDLWYRLNVFPITVPPLRRRKEDIPLLVNWFVKRFSKKLGKQITRISQEAMESLVTYDWPGNIRELENVIERSVINTNGVVLQLIGHPVAPTVEDPIGPERKPLAQLERDYIVQILEETNWKISGRNSAADILGLNPSTLRGRMRKLNISRS